MDEFDYIEAPRLGVLATFLRMPDWYADARCADADPDLFFPAKGESPADAVKVCRSCPVREECLDYALGIEWRDPGQREGVWGGLTVSERAALARQATRRAVA